MIALPGAPFPVTYRELWLPPGINEHATLPTSVEGGHGLALTGARKGTTADGVHFNGAVTSNINCGAIHNNIAKLWVSFRFKLDQDYIATLPNRYVWGKYLDATHYIIIRLDTVGSLVFTKDEGGAIFTLISAVRTWNAGQWYHVLVSLTDTDGGIQRLLIDNVLEDSDTQGATNTPNGGDIVIGDFDDPGGGTGFEGVIADVVVGTDDLSQAAPDEEYDLYAGIPPADAVNFWPLDEGRGLGAVAIDRGSGGNNGTLDTSCTWAFGQVEQPVLSLDGINDRADSPAGADIIGDLTVVWVGKMKSTYDATSMNKRMFYLTIDANNLIILWYQQSVGNIRFYTVGSAVPSTVELLINPVIDEFWVVIGTRNLTVTKLFLNGGFLGTQTGGGVIGGGPATAHLGSSGPGDHDISKPLFAALIDGVFTNKQARAYSRYLKNVFNLPITI